MTTDNDFMKRKMTFTLGLLGALFALHPFYPKFDAISFTYMGVTIPMSYALMTIGVFLAIATYFFSAGMTEDSPSGLGQRLGNSFYGLAVMTVPLYAGLYVTTLLEKYIVLRDLVSDQQMHAPIITLGVLGFWGLLWAGTSFMVRRYLTKHDWTSKVDGLIDREMSALARAKEMMEGGHDDLAVIQLHKAVVTRAKLICLKRNIWYGSDPLRSIASILDANNAHRIGIVLKANVTAQSPRPISREEAQAAWTATKNFLSSSAV